MTLMLPPESGLKSSLIQTQNMHENQNSTGIPLSGLKSVQSKDREYLPLTMTGFKSGGSKEK